MKRIKKYLIWLMIWSTISLGFPVHTSMYFSVGVSTNDFKTASNVTVAGTTATFISAQTNDSIGIGDQVVYNTTDTAYIVGKTSKSVWTVRSKTGGVPQARSNVACNSIKRTFNSLTAALDGSSSGAEERLGTADLTSGDGKNLYIACYKDAVDAGGDTEITGWTVDVSSFITVYTPYDTSTQCNSRQRHTGVAETGYLINPSGPIDIAVIYIQNKYTVVEGIEITDFGTINDAGIQPSTTADSCTIDGNIIHDDGGTTVRGINAATNVDGAIIINNIVYDMSEHGITADDLNYIYNNTVYNCGEDGINNNNSTPVIVNNISMGTTQKDYEDNGGSWGTGTDYNLDSDGLAPGGNSQHNKAASNQFQSITGGSENFHLKAGSDAIDHGIGPSADSDVPTLDIDFDTRSGAIADIGIDETDLNGVDHLLFFWDNF